MDLQEARFARCAAVSVSPPRSLSSTFWKECRLPTGDATSLGATSLAAAEGRTTLLAISPSPSLSVSPVSSGTSQLACARSGFIAQFHAPDDPFIPLAEARHVAENLGSALTELPGRSHFFEPFDELLAELRSHAPSKPDDAQ